jgi:hypothetical protein
MVRAPTDPEPSREPGAWKGDDTFRLLTADATDPWTAQELTSLFQMWRQAGQATFFQVLARLLEERALTNAYVAALNDHREKLVEHVVATFTTMAADSQEFAAALKARKAELANPAAALARRRRGTTSREKPWRRHVAANQELMRRVLDPAVRPTWVARRIEALLENQEGVTVPQRKAILDWIRKLRNPAAAQAQ